MRGASAPTTRHRSPALLVLGLSAALLGPLAAPAAELAIDREASLFAIVTHKGGFAAGLGHDHLVVAEGYRARLEFDPADPLGTSFEFEAEVEKLVVDRGDLQQRWYPRLAELAVLDEPFGEVSDKDRRKIREAMLSGKQLDAAHQTRVFARLVGIEEGAAQIGEAAFTHRARLEIEVHGVEIERPVAARYRLADGRLAIDALAELRFTDFGIEPYSAALGAVKNLDDFHLFVHLEAALPKAPPAP